MSGPPGSPQSSGLYENPSQPACFWVSSVETLMNAFSGHALRAYYKPGTGLDPEEPEALPEQRQSVNIYTGHLHVISPIQGARCSLQS